MNQNKQYRATQTFLMGSPRKLRLVVAVIKKMTPLMAVERLPFVGKRAAGDLSKVITSAIANAKNQGASDTSLIFKEIQIGEGPRLKRGKAASRGRWHARQRKMSHIRVVLTTKSEIKPVKAEKTVETAEVVKEAKKEVKAKVVKREVKKEVKK
jgi:large subunit ribosomal protein L22